MNLNVNTLIYYTKESVLKFGHRFEVSNRERRERFSRADMLSIDYLAQTCKNETASLISAGLSAAP